MIFKHGLSSRALAYFGFKTFLILNETVQVQRLLLGLLTFFLLCRFPGHLAAKLLSKLVEFASDRLFFLIAQALGLVLTLCGLFLVKGLRQNSAALRHMHDYLDGFRPMAFIFICIFCIVEFTGLPQVLGDRLRRLAKPVFGQHFGVKVTALLLHCADELLHYFLLVYFHVDDTLSLLAGQLVLLNFLEHIMYTCRSFLLDVVDGFTLADTIKATHDGGLNQTNRSVHVMVIQLWYQDLVSFLY